MQLLPSNHEKAPKKGPEQRAINELCKYIKLNNPLFLNDKPNLPLASKKTTRLKILIRFKNKDLSYFSIQVSAVLILLLTYFGSGARI
ncbi:hypothetical protein A9R01_06665 ['Osedax' symbiont bacterium Rs2_46_30_T18]|nr:hypothetical protein A9R01_06665 ['Osedax' symbiont bacterium Rs2_46_30_T18]